MFEFRKKFTAYSKNLFKRFCIFFKRSGTLLIAFSIDLIKLFIRHGTFVAAVATLILAGLTYCHIEVTKDMAVETKRLADISVEQFKIKAYPTFLIEFQPFTYTPWQPLKNKPALLTLKYKIFNQGEITAHGVTYLNILFFQTKNNTLHAASIKDAYHKIPGMPAIDYETKIWGEAAKMVTVEHHFTKENNIENLKNFLVFIKFKVPYDDKYRYEAWGYILVKNFEEENMSSSQWKEMSTTDRESLVRSYFNAPNINQPYLKAFFVDYYVSSETPPA